MNRQGQQGLVLLMLPANQQDLVLPLILLDRQDLVLRLLLVDLQDLVLLQDPVRPELPLLHYKHKMYKLLRLHQGSHLH